MSDPNEEARGKIARAIVYAVRQATLINQYGMTWEAIEVNTANILAGCSVPADGKMNSAEAVSNHIYDMLKRGLISPYEARAALVEPVSPGSPEMRVALALVDNYHAAKQELARMKAALSVESVAAMEARQEALANKVERDDFAQKWATLKGECHAQNQRANQAEDALKASELCRDQLRRDLASVTQANIDNAAERDKALDAYATLRESMRPHPDHARLAELEARNVELRQMLEQSQEARELDAFRLERDRDGFRRGAQFWMDSSNDRKTERDKAEAKVVKLRTFLQRSVCNPWDGSTNAINTILEETK